jgi:predicted ABC-type transport system involved in lysophospholipase L1 biosynthesis ATPase subunit
VTGDLAGPASGAAAVELIGVTAGLDSPTSGTVRLGGSDLSGPTLRIITRPENG